MALLFLDGVDHYDSSAEMARKWDTVDIASIQTTGGRFGGGAVRLILNDDIEKVFTPAATIVCGFGVLLEQLQDVGNAQILRFNNSGTVHVTISITPQGGFLVERSTGSFLGQTAGDILHGGVWHYIEVLVFISNTVGVVTIQVDGAQVDSFTGLDTRNGGLAQIDRIRWDYAGGTSNVMDLDDFYILDTSGSPPQDTFLGDIRIDTIFPDADGNYTEFTTTNPASPTTHWDKVEEPAVDTASFNETTTANQRDTFTMANLNAITNQTIFGLQQVSHAQDTAGTSNFRNILRISGSDFNGATQALLNGTDAFYLEIWPLDPNAGPGAWVESVINGIESGYEDL